MTRNAESITSTVTLIETIPTMTSAMLFQSLANQISALGVLFFQAPKRVVEGQDLVEILVAGQLQPGQLDAHSLAPPLDPAPLPSVFDELRRMASAAARKKCCRSFQGGCVPPSRRRYASCTRAVAWSV